MVSQSDGQPIRWSANQIGQPIRLVSQSEYSIEKPIKKRLNDQVAESRAYWALGNAHRSLGNLERAAFYTRRHLEISREVGDIDGINSAEETLLQLETASEAPSSPCHSLLRRRRSMEQLDMTIGQSETSSDSSGTRNLNKENEEDMFDILTRIQGSRLDDQRANQKRVQTRKEDIDNLLNQIAGINGANRRMDKQRVSLAEINEPIRID